MEQQHLELVIAFYMQSITKTFSVLAKVHNSILVFSSTTQVCIMVFALVCPSNSLFTFKHLQYFLPSLLIISLMVVNSVKQFVWFLQQPLWKTLYKIKVIGKKIIWKIQIMDHYPLVYSKYTIRVFKMNTIVFTQQSVIISVLAANQSPLGY